MQCPQVSQIVHVDVHASQVQALSDPVVQFAVQASQDFLPRRADRSLGQRDEVKIADTGDIIPAEYPRQETPSLTIGDVMRDIPKIEDVLDLTVRVIDQMSPY
jgi:hypothetical protein